MTMSQTLRAIPPYPSSKTRASLSPSQQTELNEAISSGLRKVLELPPAQRDSPTTSAFLATYARDVAHQTLQDLIWTEKGTGRSFYQRLSRAEKGIRHSVFLLAEKMAVTGSLQLQTLVDLSVVYASTNPSRVRSLFSSAFEHASLSEQVERELVPAFESLLSNHSQGLYGIRKAAHVVLSFIRPSPPEGTLSFSRSKSFILALARAYDHGLLSLSQSYGGFRIPASSSTRPLDEWERVFLETKVDLLDVFHILITALLESVAVVPSAGLALAAQCEPAFEVIFALLDVQPSQSGQETTPFLDRPLLADYQHAYDLSSVLNDVLRRVDDARTDHLAATLRSLDAPPAHETGASGSRGASPKSGALKLLISSSGVPPGIDNLGNGTRMPSTVSKGKLRASPPVVEDDPELDSAVLQILDVLPEQSPSYIRFLLSHSDYAYKRDAERLLDALFSGTAPSVEEVEAAMRASATHDELTEVNMGRTADDFTFTKERRNVFDDEVVDMNLLHIGKKEVENTTSLTDRAFIDEMKSNILRLAEAVSDSDSEDNDGRQLKGKEVAFEEELDDDGGVLVRDGEGTDDDSEDEEQDGGDGAAESESKKNPEIVLELAYIQDPKLFERDAQTRRSKERANLKTQTGWSDEQIEGWKIMLERNPKKDKILAKHEFAGNRTSSPAPTPAPGPSQPRGGGSRGGRRSGRGRGGYGRGRGRGGGGGGQHQGGEGGGDGAGRDRAWKDKNKASRGNHDRKRGHDKKMARAGGPS